MADLASITGVTITDDTRYSKVPYGATISPGNSLYLDPSDGEYKLADCDEADQASDTLAIAITPGSDGGQGLVATGGSITLVGTTMVVGEPYVVSDTAGNIMPETDLTTGQYVRRLGTAATATQLDLNLDPTGIQHA